MCKFDNAVHFNRSYDLTLFVGTFLHFLIVCKQKRTLVALDGEEEVYGICFIFRALLILFSDVVVLCVEVSTFLGADWLLLCRPQY